MIAADTSSIIAFLCGEAGDDVDLLDQTLADHCLVIPPVVLSELLSDPKLTPDVRSVLSDLPQLSIGDGYWERVGLLRAKVIAKKLKARLADALVAQSCLDHKLALITRDRDFRHFAKLAGLRLLP